MLIEKKVFIKDKIFEESDLRKIFEFCKKKLNTENARSAHVKLSFNEEKREYSFSDEDLNRLFEDLKSFTCDSIYFSINSYPKLVVDILLSKKDLTSFFTIAANDKDLFDGILQDLESILSKTKKNYLSKNILSMLEALCILIGGLLVLNIKLSSSDTFVLFMTFSLVIHIPFLFIKNLFSDVEFNFGPYNQTSFYKFKKIGKYILGFMTSILAIYGFFELIMKLLSFLKGI